jgi:ribosomal protein S18 acetylase RimI-like enzyme
MSFAIRQAWPTDFERLVEVAVSCQLDPDRACGYLSSDAAALGTELEEIDGAEHWTAVTWVALDDAREVIGWIAAQSDAEMRRAWWFGPFLADASSLLADATADGLFRAGRRALEGFDEHELALDSRSSFLTRFAERNGFGAAEGSAVLRASGLAVDVPKSPATIDAGNPSDAEAIALHDQIFPGTHSTGGRLFGLAGDRHDHFVARIEGEVVGYVVTELQYDGSLYIDYLGVSEACRGQGVGGALVATAMNARAHEASHADLTVRTSNSAARRLYALLGFTEDLVLIPYRIGFTID